MGTQIANTSFAHAPVVAPPPILAAPLRAHTPIDAPAGPLPTPRAPVVAPRSNAIGSRIFEATHVFAKRIWERAFTPIAGSVGLASATLMAGCRSDLPSIGLLCAGAAVALAPSAVSSLSILTQRRPSQATMGWLAASWMFPVLGPALWFGVGAEPHVPDINNPGARFWSDRYAGLKPDTATPDAVPEGLPDYFQPMLDISRRITRTPLTAGNAVIPLYNGEEAFPEMIKAIDKEPAGGFVSMGFFIFENNETGVQFADALERAMKRGVRVRVIVDKWGSLATMPSGYALLKKRGIPVMKFNPPVGLRNGIPWNLVYHKKFMATSQAAFVGSMNVGDTYVITKPGVHNPHQDVTYLFEGPMLRDVVSVFDRDWKLLTGEAPTTSPLNLKPSGSSFVRVIRTAPDEDFETFKKITMAALVHARHHVRITTGYFAPDEEFLTAIKIAARNGVKVEFALSYDGNFPFIDWGARATYSELTSAGADIFYQPPPFNHTKFITVDDMYSLFGSTNLGPRYMSGNEEVNVEIYDRDLATQLATYFDKSKGPKDKVTREEIASWPWYQRVRNGFFRLFSWLY